MKDIDRNILYNFFEGRTNTEEEQRIRLWYESSPENAKKFYAERRFYDATLFSENKAKDKITKHLYVKIPFNVFLKVAAMITIIISLSFFYFDKYNSNVAINKIYVPIGQRVNIILSDGTDVWLNSNTTMIYPSAFKGGERKIKLDGEGFFKVAPNKNKPFKIETEKYDIQVLGTTFNVNAYSNTNDFVTSLLEGSVKLKKGNRSYFLKPKYQAEEINNKLSFSEIKNYNVFRWKEGLLCFEDVLFEDIIKKLESVYALKVKVHGYNKNCDTTISGKFRTIDGFDSALRAIRNIIPFTYCINKTDGKQKTVNIYFKPNKPKIM